LRLAHCFVLFCALTAGALGHSRSAHAENLQDSVLQAISFHPTVESRRANSKAVSEEITEKKSDLYPTVSLNLNTGRLDANDETTRGFTGDNAQSYNTGGSLRINQLLYDGMQTKHRIKASSARHNAAEYEIDVSEEQIALRAIRAHLDVMRNWELMEQVNLYIHRLEKHKNNIALLVNEGAADETELMQADDVLIRDMNSRIDFEKQAQNAEAEYMEATGHLPTSTLVADTNWAGHIPETLSEALETGLKYHPRLHSARITAKAAEYQKDIEEASIIPKFNAELAYSETDQEDEVGAESTRAEAFVRMTWDFSTGGAYSARIRKASHRISESIAKEQEARRAVEKEIRTAYAEMTSAQDRERLMTDREKKNRDILKTYTQQFEGGQRTVLQIIGAESRYFEALIARINAQYRSVLANFQFLSSMGRLRPALNVSEGVRVDGNG